LDELLGLLDQAMTALTESRRPEVIEDLVSRIEAALSSGTLDLDEHLTFASHYTVAALMLQQPAQVSDTLLRRVLGHLEAAREPGTPELNKSITLKAVEAFYNFSDVRAEGTIDQVITALRAGLAAHGDVADTPNRAVLSYRCGSLLLDRFVRRRAPEDLAEAAERLELARDLYHQQQRLREEGDACFLLGQVRLNQSKEHALGTAGRDQLVEEAYALLQRSRELSDSNEQTQDWAERNRLVGRALLLRAAGSPLRRFQDATSYFDAAMLSYELRHDVVRAGQVALEILDAASAVPPPWPPDWGTRHLFYIRNARLVAQGAADPEDEARLKLALANHALRTRNAISSQTPPEITELALALATSAAEICARTGSRLGFALASVAAGNALLGKPGQVNRDADRLRDAARHFRAAANTAAALAETSLEGQATRQLGAALTELAANLGQADSFPEAVAALERATQLSAGSELAGVRINLSNLISLGYDRGWCDTALVDRAREQLRLVLAEADPIDDAFLRTLASERLAELDAATFLAPSAAHAEGRRDAAPQPATGDRGAPALPARGFLRTVESLAADGPEPQPFDFRVRLIASEQPEADSFAVPLEHRGGGSLWGSFPAVCPRCESAIDAVIPWFLDWDIDDTAHKQLTAGTLTVASCGTCGARTRFEAPFVMLDRKFAAGPILVWLDKEGADTGRLVRGQAGRLEQTLAFVGGGWDPKFVSVPWLGLQLLDAISFEAAQTFRQQTALAKLVNCVLRRDWRSMAHLATESGATLERIGTVDESALREVLPEEAQQQLTPPQLEGLAQALNWTLEQARTQGWEAAIQGITQLVAAQGHAERDWEATLDLARDPTRRRDFLKQWLRDSPDYSAERAEMLRGTLRAGAQLRLLKMEEQGLDRTDPESFESFKANMGVMEDMIADLIAKDRQQDTHPKAKQILRQALTECRPFGFLLRSFNLDNQKVNMAQQLAPFDAKPGDPRVAWRLISSQGRLGPGVSLAASLAPLLPVLAIEDRRDLLHRPELPALRVPDPDWRSVVACLMGEAQVLLVFIQPRAPGLIEELVAIKTLELEGKTLVIRMDATEDSGLIRIIRIWAELRSDVDEGELELDLSGFGKFAGEFQERDLRQDPGPLREAVQRLVAAPSAAGAQPSGNP
jgi:hypothetical protein